MPLRRMLFACWLTKATHTHSEYVIHLAFPRQQWLCERVSVLRYTTLPAFLVKKGQQFRTPQEAPPVRVRALYQNTIR